MKAIVVAYKRNSCMEEGCAEPPSYFQGGEWGYCCEHGGIPECSAANCLDLQSFMPGGMRGFCAVHGGHPKCEAAGCFRHQMSELGAKRGFCRRHCDYPSCNFQDCFRPQNYFAGGLVGYCELHGGYPVERNRVRVVEQRSKKLLTNEAVSSSRPEKNTESAVICALCRQAGVTYHQLGLEGYSRCRHLMLRCTRRSELATPSNGSLVPTGGSELRDRYRDPKVPRKLLGESQLQSTAAFPILLLNQHCSNPTRQSPTRQSHPTSQSTLARPQKTPPLPILSSTGTSQPHLIPQARFASSAKLQFTLPMAQSAGSICARNQINHRLKASEHLARENIMRKMVSSMEASREAVMAPLTAWESLPLPHPHTDKFRPRVAPKLSSPSHAAHRTEKNVREVTEKKSVRPRRRGATFSRRRVASACEPCHRKKIRCKANPITGKFDPCFHCFGTENVCKPWISARRGRPVRSRVSTSNHWSHHIRPLLS